MGDDDRLDAHPGQPFDALLDGAVQAAAGLPHDQRALPAGPVGHLGVVADDGDGEGRAGGDDALGHPPDEGLAIGVREGVAEPPLGVGERLDRDEHGPTAEHRAAGAPVSGRRSR